MTSQFVFGILFGGIIVLTIARPQDESILRSLESSSDSSSVSSDPSPAARSSNNGALSVECGRKEVSPGQFKFSCDNIGSGNSDALTLRSEHVLWLQQNGGQSQNLEVLVPNYRIDELIKAAFKGGVNGGTRINIMLKRPDHTYNAEIGPRNESQSPPTVKVEYEPVQDLLVHYPNDKPFRPVSGALLPPALQNLVDPKSHDLIL